MARVTIKSLSAENEALRQQCAELIAHLSVKHPPQTLAEQQAAKAEPQTVLAQQAVGETEIQSRHPTQAYTVDFRKDYGSAVFLAKQKAKCGWTSRVKRDDGTWLTVYPPR